MEIIGYSRKRGEYHGREYDNTYLYCTSPIDKKNGEGVFTISLRIKTELCFEGFSIGDEIIPYYDRYGNCIGFDRVIE